MLCLVFLSIFSVFLSFCTLLLLLFKYFFQQGPEFACGGTRSTSFMASVGWDVIEGAVATEQWTKHESLSQMEKTKKPRPVANTRGEIEGPD